MTSAGLFVNARISPELGAYASVTTGLKELDESGNIRKCIETGAQTQLRNGNEHAAGCREEAH